MENVNCRDKCYDNVENNLVRTLASVKMRAGGKCFTPCDHPVKQIESVSFPIKHVCFHVTAAYHDTLDSHLILSTDAH